MAGEDLSYPHCSCADQTSSQPITLATITVHCPSHSDTKRLELPTERVSKISTPQTVTRAHPLRCPPVFLIIKLFVVFIFNRSYCCKLNDALYSKSVWTCFTPYDRLFLSNSYLFTFIPDVELPLSTSVPKLKSLPSYIGHKAALSSISWAPILLNQTPRYTAKLAQADHRFGTSRLAYYMRLCFDTYTFKNRG